LADVRAELLEGYLDVDNAETVRWYRLAADRGLAGALEMEASEGAR